MHDITTAHELMHVLNAEATTAEHLLAVLSTEHQALADGDAEALEKCLMDKQPLIQQLATLSRRHQALLNQAGRVADHRDVASFLATLDPDGAALAAAWEQVRAVMDRCREQNQHNGRLVAFRRRKTEQALAILLGASPTEESYGRDGSAASSATSSRPLGSV